MNSPILVLADNGEQTDIRKYEPIVHKFAARFYTIKGYEYDDLYQIGMMALFKLAKKYHPLTNNLVYTTIQRRMYDTLKEVSGFRRKNRGEGAYSNFIITDDPDIFEQGHFEEDFSCVDIQSILKPFDLRTKKIILLSAIGFPNNEIGKKLGIHESRISQILSETKNIYLRSSNAKV